MARTEARVKVSIWANPEFRALSRAAQRTYLMLFTQPNITLCGVLAVTPGRWAKYASDGDTAELVTAFEELEAANFIVLDVDSEELFVRSFMRNDGVWRSPQTRGAARSQAEQVMSETLRAAIRVEMDRLDEKDQPDTPSDTASGTQPDTPWDGADDGTRTRVRASSSSISSSISSSDPSPIS